MRWWCPSAPVLALACAAAGCEPAPDDPAARCADAVAEYRAIASSLDESCETVDDCVALGGSSHCEGGELSIWDGAVNRAAYATVADRLDELRGDVVVATGGDCHADTCGDDLCTGPDLGPQVTTCANRHCRAEYRPFCGLPTCADYALRYADLVANLDRTCDVPEDCAVVGGPQGCKCAPSLTGDGVAVNAAALAAHQAELDDLAANLRADGDLDCDLLLLGSCGSEVACRCGVGATSATCDQGACVLVYDQLCPKE